MSSEYFIYKIINKIDGKFYIGSTCSIKRRFREHKLHLRKNKHHSIYLQRAWNKYGEVNFDFKVIMECCKKDIMVYEQNFLDILRPFDHQIGYNMNHIVDSRKDRKMSLEARKKMSIAKRGKPSPKKGMKATEETKRKLSISHLGQVAWNKGKSMSEETKRKLSVNHSGQPAWNKGLTGVMIAWNKGKFMSEETKQKQSIAAKNRPSNRKGMHHSKESMYKMSIAKKKYWKSKKKNYANV